MLPPQRCAPLRHVRRGECPNRRCRAANRAHYRRIHALPRLSRQRSGKNHNRPRACSHTRDDHPWSHRSAPSANRFSSRCESQSGLDTRRPRPSGAALLLEETPHQEQSHSRNRLFSGGNDSRSVRGLFLLAAMLSSQTMTRSKVTIAFFP